MHVKREITWGWGDGKNLERPQGSLLGNVSCILMWVLVIAEVKTECSSMLDACT